MNPVRPGDVSALEHEFLLCAASEMYKKVLVLAVRGKHRAGADGAPDSQLVEALVSFGSTLWVPDAMVFDFTGLEYAGGTMLRRALTPGEPSLEEGVPPYVTVATQ